MRFLKTLLLGMCSLSFSLTTMGIDEDNLFDLTLEELLQIKVSTGQLFDVEAKESPSALTVITAEHIKLAPAKNIAELLEIYVPGLMLMAHSEGDKIGIRGHIAVENYKLLLLLNGKDITNVVYEGVLTEIDQWQLDDIEKIEVLRGPGSVVYGSGAIAGIINIITKKPQEQFTSISLSNNFEYGSTGFSYQTSRSLGNYNSYFYTSIRKTDGDTNPKYYLTSNTDNDDNRFIGTSPSDPYAPQPYLKDAHSRPQIKTHLAIDFSDNFKFFTRFTQAGQLHHFRTLVDKEDINGNVIGTQDSRKVSTRSLMIAPDYHQRFNDQSGVKYVLTYDSQEYIRYNQINLDWPNDHHYNIDDYAFSQNRWTGSALYYLEESNWNINVGYEFRHVNVSAPWDKSSDHLLIREDLFIVNSDTDTVYNVESGIAENNDLAGKTTVEVGSGIDTYTHTNILESNWFMTENSRLHYAHRIDIPDIADTMYSPRLSFISNFSDTETFSTTIQRAQRLRPLRAQYLVDIGKKEGKKHETLDGIEFFYHKSISDMSYFNARTYYNDTNVLGFDGSKLLILGNLQLAGLEFESMYRMRQFELIMNHAFTKNIDFELTDEFRDTGRRNNISYADYNYTTSGSVGIPLTGYGDGINNWSENVTKIIISTDILNKSIQLRANLKINWDYTGAYDEMRMYQQAYANFDTSTLDATQLADFNQQKAELDQEQALLEAEDAYKRQINLGASVTYNKYLPNEQKIEASLYLQNLLQDRKRYYVNSGSSRHYPNRLNFLEEPMTISMSIRYLF